MFPGQPPYTKVTLFFLGRGPLRRGLIGIIWDTEGHVGFRALRFQISGVGKLKVPSSSSMTSVYIVPRHIALLRA